MDEHPDCCVLKQFAGHGIAHIDVVFGMPCEHDRRPAHLTQASGDQTCRKGTVDMQKIRFHGSHFGEFAHRHRSSRPIARRNSAGIQAVIGDHAIRKRFIIAFRIERRHNKSRCICFPVQIIGIVFHGIGNPVDDRRECIVEKTYFHNNLILPRYARFGVDTFHCMSQRSTLTQALPSAVL